MLKIPFEITLYFRQGITTEFFLHGRNQFNTNHRFSNNQRCRDGTGI